VPSTEIQRDNGYGQHATTRAGQALHEDEEQHDHSTDTNRLKDKKWEKTRRDQWGDGDWHWHSSPMLKLHQSKRNGGQGIQVDHANVATRNDLEQADGTPELMTFNPLHEESGVEANDESGLSTLVEVEQGPAVVGDFDTLIADLAS